jgi:hypothetical protein
MNWTVYAWFLSGVGILFLWLMGNKSKWGPIIGLMNQLMWTIYAIGIKEWGLLPVTIIPVFIHIRNLQKWQKEAA